MITNLIRHGSKNAFIRPGSVLLVLAFASPLAGYVRPSTISGITGTDVNKEQAVQEILTGIVVVDGLNYTNIQSAIDAAGKDRVVLISSAYTGTDSFRNPNNIRVFDLRRKFGLGASLWCDVREWGTKLDARMVAGC